MKKMDEKNAIDGVSCDVTHCVHHGENNCCCASSIAIGPSFACCSSETVCATFAPRAEE